MSDPWTDERIDALADTVMKGMPHGYAGFCREWGYRHFARAILECLQKDAAALAAQAPSEVERDAARYRWIRDTDCEGVVIDLPGQPADGSVWPPGELDAVIDDAIAAESGRATTHTSPASTEGREG